jgi:hypothetical protein
VGGPIVNPDPGADRTLRRRFTPNDGAAPAKPGKVSISKADLAAASASWDSVAPEKYIGLLDATPVSGG